MEAHPHLSEEGARCLLVKKGAEFLEVTGIGNFDLEVFNPLMENYTDQLCRMSKDLLKIKLLELTPVMNYEDLINDKEDCRTTYSIV